MRHLHAKMWQTASLAPANKFPYFSSPFLSTFSSLFSFSIPFFSFVHPFIFHVLNFFKNRTPTKFSILLQQILAIRYNNHGVFFTHWIGLDAEFPINVELQGVEERRFQSPNYPT